MSKSKKETHEGLDLSTEEKIKAAARKLFTQNGFAATKTRHICEEAGINLALLNYYFRSKEKLFEIVMLENLQHFFKGITQVLNSEETTIEQKVESFVAIYTDMLLKQPDIPLFILNELRGNPERLASKLGAKEVILKSHFMKQLQQEMKSGKIAAIHPMHYVINMLSMTIFPFIAQPIIRSVGDLSASKFDEIIKERKAYIPKWFKATTKVK
jgi:AcrR family transcriptional regulator